MVGNAAVVRHIYLAQSELEGKPTTTRIGARQVWQKQDDASARRRSGSGQRCFDFSVRCVDGDHPVHGVRDDATSTEVFERSALLGERPGA